MTTPYSKKANNLSESTFEEWINLPEELHAELIDGKLIYESMPNLEHGRSRGRLFSFLSPLYDHSKSLQNKPGGWWL